MARSTQATTVPVDQLTAEQLRTTRQELDGILSGRSKSRHVSPELGLVLQENDIAKLTKPDALRLRDAIENFLQQSRPVKIITPYPLDATQQRSLMNWFQTTMSNTVLLSFRVDSSLIAGVVIQTPKTRLDFTLLAGAARGQAYLHQVVHAQ